MKYRFNKDQPLKAPTEIKIGRKYHLSWARSRGMVWILKAIEGDKAILETPKTHKVISSLLSDLRMTRTEQVKTKNI